MYDEQIAGPMRAELTQLGFEETRTPQEVDAALQEKKGTVLVVVNSVCGCAAGVARPAIALSLENGVRPGNDREATARAREYFVGYRPSSPSVALFRDGQLVKMIERWQIEGRAAHDIASELAASFNEYCVRETVA